MLMPMPKSIVETNIAKPPKKYEGFLYRFTNLKNQRVYVGVHKGQYGDGYWNSATDEELKKELASSDGEFKYEIMEYGRYSLMTVLEHKILKSADAPNNPLYYNKTVGSPMYKTVRTALVSEIVLKIRGGKFPTKKEMIKDVAELKRLQIRAKDIGSHQTDIAQRVDDAAGNTDNLYVTVLENRNGEDLRIDGAHTVGGIVKSKLGQDVNVIRIPESVHKNLNNPEIRFLGNLLNKKKDVPVVETDDDDAIKQIVGNYEFLGTPAIDPSNQEMLRALGFSSQKAKALQKKAKVETDSIAAKLKFGKVFIDWTAYPFTDRLNAILDDGKSSNKMILDVSSGYVRNDRILHEIYTVNQGRISIGEPEKKEVDIFVKHPSEDFYDKWKDGEETNNLKFLKYFLNDKDMVIKFKDLPMYEDDLM